MTAALLPVALTLLAAGALSGFLAGLFGVGGGTIAVPIFHATFLRLGLADAVAMPLAVGSSLAVMVPTAFVSARTHRAKGAMDEALLRLWAVPVILGVAVGAVVARYANPMLFKLVFVVFALVTAAKLLAGGDRWRLAPALPGPGPLRAYGAVIGFLSSLIGIGGGALSNLVLTLHAVPIHRAVATGAGMGVLISGPGALGYILAGWGKPGLPPDATGYVSWLAVAATVPATLVTARWGADVAHRLSRKALERALGLYLLLVAARFAWSAAA